MFSMKSNSHISRILAVAGIISVISIFPACNGGEEPAPKEPEYASVKGTVSNQDGLKISGANVAVASKSVVTDAGGQFSFTNLEPGSSNVTVTADGYETLSQAITLKSGQNADLNLVLKAAETQFSVSKETVDADFNSTDVEVEITSNAKWEVKTDAAWLRLSPTSGTGNAKVDIHFDLNKEDASRESSLVFTAGSKTVEVPVSQLPQLKVISTQAILGNELTDTPDELRIKFNKPISKINSASIDMFRKWEPTDMTTSQPSPDEVVFKFKFGLISDLTARLEVVNTFDVKEEVTAESGFYSKKITLKDCMATQMSLCNDGKELLVAAIGEDNRIIRIDAGTGEVIKAFSIPEEPTFYFSKYDGKCYIMQKDVNKLFTLDLETGDLDTVYEFESEETYKIVIPYQLGILSDGKGIVALRCNESSALRWRFIDFGGSEITTRELPNLGVENPLEEPILEICTNFDASKLYISGEYGYRYYNIYELGKPEQFVKIIPPYTTRGYLTYASLTEDRIFARQLYNQFVMDGEGNCSSSVELDARHDGGCAFCYDKGLENNVYVCEMNQFNEEPASLYILDMGSAEPEIIAQHFTAGMVDGFFTDLNGKAYCFDAYGYNSSDTDIFIFETSQLNGMLN